MKPTVSHTFWFIFDIVDVVKFPQDNKYAFTNSVDSPRAFENSDEVIYVLDENGQLINSFGKDKLPSGLISSRPVGWSRDGKFLYITKIGWEGFEYSGLWKVNMQTKNIEEIKEVDNKVALGDISVLPALDLAVATVSGVDRSQGMGGESIPPSKINVYDLAKNTFTTIITSKKNLLTAPILAPSGKKIFFAEIVNNEDRVIYSVDINGANKKKVTDVGFIVSMSEAGDMVVIETNENDKLLDLTNNTEKIIYKNSNKEQNRFLQCNFPLGFSCFYQK